MTNSRWETFKHQMKANNEKLKSDMSKAKDEFKKVTKQTDAPNGLLEDLGGRGEKLFKQNISEKEEIVVKIKGSFGEGLVLSNQRLYVLKWGLMAGNIIGGRCIAFDYKSITGLEIKKSLLTGTFEVLTASTQNTQKSYWGSGENNAIKSDNIVTFQRNAFNAFIEAVKIGREMISQSHNLYSNQKSPYDDLERLAELKDKGLITDKEFSDKKKQLLGV